MRFGLIGYGSIGKRHVKNLLALGNEDIILLRGKGAGNELGLTEVNSLDALLAEEPDAVLVTNPTSKHFEYLSELIPRNMNLLVEKPLVSDASDLNRLRALLPSYEGFGMAAFNMRYHPVVVQARDWLQSGRMGQLYSARFHVGQYLPDWRPDQDYRESYSASRELGGGVILDLIHELDLAAHLVGLPADTVSRRVSRSANLEIDTEALAEVLYTDSRGAVVSVHLDYLTQGYRRHFELVGSEASLSADLQTSCMTFFLRDGGEEQVSFDDFERNDMYLALMQGFLNGLMNREPNPLPLHEVLIVNELALALRDGQAYGD